MNSTPGLQKPLILLSHRYLGLLLASFFLSLAATGQSALETGKSLFLENKFPQAEKILSAIGKNSGDYAASQYFLGRIDFGGKKYENALEHFLHATETNPQVGEYFSWLGDTYAEIGATANVFRQMSVGPKALRAWESAVKLDPKNISARQSLASNYLIAPAFMGGGEAKAKAVAKEALALLDEDLKLHPDRCLHQYWYGKMAALTGYNLANGAVWLQKYLEHVPTGDEPSLAAAHMRLAQIEERQGRKAEARKQFETALKLDPTLKPAKEGLERTSR